MKQEDSKFISTDEVSALVGVSPRVVQAALRKGELKGRNMRGRRGWVTTKEAVSAWIESGNPNLDKPDGDG